MFLELRFFFRILHLYDVLHRTSRNTKQSMKYGTSEAYRNKKVLVLKNIRQNILCRNTMLNQGLKLGFNNLQAKLKERLVNLWNLKAKNPF